MVKMIQKRKLLLLIIAVLVASISINALTVVYSLKIYRQYKQFQIDPAGYLVYGRLNTAAGKKKPGFTRIVFFGDSRIYQWENLPDLPGCEMLNRGRPGDTTAMAVLRLERDVIDLDPDLVVIQIGGNDCNAIGVLTGMENEITANCVKNIDLIVDKLERKKIRVIILTIFPFGSIDLYRLPVWSERARYAAGKVNMAIMKYNTILTSALDCDTVFMDDVKMKKEYSRDTLHINREGYLRLNAFVYPFIKDQISGVKSSE